MGQGQLHEMDDQIDTIRPLTKWRRRVKSINEISTDVQEAFRQMLRGRCRPVELEIPSDILDGEGDVDIVEPSKNTRIEGSDEDIARAVKSLVSAQQPAIAAGGGALRSNAARPLARIAELLQAPIVTSQQGRGLVGCNHPLYVGVHYAGLGVSSDLLNEADVILAVGTRLLIKDFVIRPEQTLVKLDIDAKEIMKAPPETVTVHADAAAGLEAMAEMLEVNLTTSNDGSKRAKAYKRRFLNDLRFEASAQLEWVEAIREAAAPDAVVVAGMTTIGYWSYLAFDADPAGVFMTPGYFGALGYGFPTALGASIGAPNRQVVCITGDGGFMYNVQELATASKHHIDLAIVLFDNGSYGASQWDQSERWQGRIVGTDLNNPHWLTLARAFGASYRRALNPPDLTKTLVQALKEKGPSIVHVQLPNMAPPFQLPGRIGW
jgi:acetolactate synthase-1/2/3 large subunit